MLVSAWEQWVRLLRATASSDRTVISPSGENNPPLESSTAAKAPKIKFSFQAKPWRSCRCQWTDCSPAGSDHPGAKHFQMLEYFQLQERQNTVKCWKAKVRPKNSGRRRSRRHWDNFHRWVDPFIGSILRSISRRIIRMMI